jgi:hypothetical protein
MPTTLLEICDALDDEVHLAVALERAIAGCDLDEQLRDALIELCMTHVRRLQAIRDGVDDLHDAARAAAA